MEQYEEGLPAHPTSLGYSVSNRVEVSKYILSVVDGIVIQVTTKKVVRWPWLVEASAALYSQPS